MGEVGTTKVYENEKIIVWEFTLEPGEETPLHEHKHDYIFYIQNGSKLQVFGEEGNDLDAVKSKPAMLACGLKDRAIHPENAIADFRALFPNAPVNTFPDAGHFCQEDIPEILVPLIHQFIQMN